LVSKTTSSKLLVSPKIMVKRECSGDTIKKRVTGVKKGMKCTSRGGTGLMGEGGKAGGPYLYKSLSKLRGNSQALKGGRGETGGL